VNKNEVLLDIGSKSPQIAETNDIEHIVAEALRESNAAFNHCALLGKKVIVIMPAYNAALTLEKTFNDIPHNIISDIILTDDGSTDETVEISKRLGIKTFVHTHNSGYGANQKTCYREALKTNADIIVMLHPDCQYDPRVIPFAVGFITTGICDVIVGSRIRTRHETLQGGMPIYKYISNRFLTALENFVFGQNLGDFHSGFRVYKKEVLETINYQNNSNDFIFDTEFLAQAIYHGFRVGDVPIPTRYYPEASSINFRRSLKYGIQCLSVMAKYILQASKLLDFRIFKKSSSENT
jgi:glycosyltransferase involved in cell wall biosynthesis